MIPTRPADFPRTVRTPDGMDIRMYLSQEDLWATPEGMIQVTDMTPDHKRHARKWLDDNATGLILVMESTMNEDIVNGENPQGLGMVLALMNTRPKEWVSSTTLYRALSA